MTQQALSDLVGVHVPQIRRFGAGTSQPTLEVLRAIAVGLSVSTDALVLNEDERGPADDQLRLHLEALNQLDDEKAPSSTSSSPSWLRHQARRLARSS